MTEFYDEYKSKLIHDVWPDSKKNTQPKSLILLQGIIAKPNNSFWFNL